MIIQVIETKRSPPIWGVKAGHRFKAAFSGADARAKAESFALENFGAFTIKAKPELARAPYVQEPVPAK